MKQQTFSDKSIPLYLLLLQLCFIVLFVVWFPGINFSIIPRNSGLWTVMTSPLIHADWDHLSGNLQVFIPAYIVLFLLYPRNGMVVFISIYLLSGLALWIFGEYAAHIGLSGVIIGIIYYLVLAGLFSLNAVKIIISFTLSMLHYAVLSEFYNTQDGVSSDSHICGFLAGFIVVTVEYFPRKSLKFS